MIKFKLISNIGYTQLSKVVSKDELRPALTGVNVNLQHKRLEATDSYILICYGIESESKNDSDNSIILPTKIFNKNHFYSQFDISKMEMNCFEFRICTDSKMAYVFLNEVEVYKSYLIEGKYPNIETVLNITKSDMSYDFMISLDLISRIKKATSEKGIDNHFEFYLNGQNKALKFKKIYNENIYGLIMPCSN